MIKRCARLVLGALWCTCCVTAWADPPQISNIVPYGVPRGVSTEVTISGANLADKPRLLIDAPIRFEPPATLSSDAANWKIRLTLPPDTPVAVFPVRVLTDQGISNPFLLAVGQLPNQSEIEPNTTPTQAQTIGMPVVVEGQLAGNDVDYFKFSGLKGQKLLFDAQCARIGSGVDPQLRLTTSRGRFVASADDSPGLFTDARMLVELPEDGEYVLEISDTKYQGAGRAVYRLVMGAMPVADEVFPLGGRRQETVGLELRGGTLPAGRAFIGAATLSAGPSETTHYPRLNTHMLGLAGPTDPIYEIDIPAPLDVSDYPELREPAEGTESITRGVAPVVFNGRIDKPGDEDRFHIATTPGQVLRFRVHAADLGSALDASIQILNAANNQSIASGDDTQVPPNGLPKQPRKPPGTTSADPSIDVTVPGGVTDLALVVRDLTGQGGVGHAYRVVVEPATPTFQLALAGEPQVSIPRGGTATIPFSVTRQGYNGPVTIAVNNPPAGLAVRPGHVGEGHVVGVLSLSAAPDAAFDAVSLNIVGTGQGPAGPIVEQAGKVIVYAQQANLPSHSRYQVGLASAPAPARILALDAPADPVEAVHGYPASFNVKVARSGDSAKGELTIEAIQPAPGLAVPAAKIETEAAEGAVSVNIDPSTYVGDISLGLQAKGKFEDKDQVFGLPVVRLRVVRPVSVEPSAQKLELKPGETVELKGRLTRRGPFKEAVTLQVNGLPGGLKAEPVTVAPEASEFVFQVVADAAAEAAEANAQLAVASFKLADKDYNVPPTPIAVKIVK